MVPLSPASQSPGVIADLFAQNVRSGGVLRVLQAIRKYLGMNIAFVSRFRESDRVMEHVDADGVSELYVGQTIPLEQGYCLKVALGELPELIPDTSRLAAAMQIPETDLLKIGAHLSVPIRLPNGQLYGTLCCYRHSPDLTLGERDLAMMRALAEVLAVYLEDVSNAAQAQMLKLNAIRTAIQSCPRIVYQPIYGLGTGALLGMECLSRFDYEDPRSPSQWFALADEVGLRTELEMAAIRRALQTLSSFPPSIYFALNSSPQSILSGAVEEALRGADPRRLVLEITEHAMVDDYEPLLTALRPLRQRGVRVAIDDAGAGYSSMRHIVNLRPDFIKLDSSLTAQIDRDPARRALARALASFAQEIGSIVIAEGIETRAELELLQGLGIETGQGFFLQEPVPVDIACQPEMAVCRVRPSPMHLPM